MGFFDDLGKKVSDAGQKTVQKTKDMSEIMRINSLISQTESKLNENYMQIGKLYVSVHGEEGEESFAQLVTAVKNMNMELASYRQQVQDLKGFQPCPQCGASVQKGAAFCSACGFAMPQIVPQPSNDDYVICSKCGSPVNRDNRFCTNCGQIVLHSEEEPKVAPEPVCEEVQPEVVNRVCPNCGASVQGDSAFCINCGTRL